MHILLAEDNDILRKSLSFFLQSNGFEVEQHSNGREALESIQKNPFDVIITDINMPGISGIEITEQVRSGLRKDTPIIIFTSSNVEQTELDSFHIGANDFMAKPVSPSVLLMRIKKLINQGRS